MKSIKMNDVYQAALYKFAGSLKNMNLQKWIFVIVILLVTVFTVKAQQSKMKPLFDGKSLKGWMVRSGSATYMVKDGAIVGTTVEGSPNTFLCTKKEFGDFLLEFEVKFDPELNSGVQFRSHAYEKETEIVDPNGNKNRHAAGRVFGYQCEIATSGSGGVYDEARRAVFISGENKATAQIKTNDWNRFRIIARGDHFQTFVNDVLISDFHDNMDARGFIGLQVHQVNKGAGPFYVRWRNINILELKPNDKL